jgi:hypothetical protein
MNTQHITSFSDCGFPVNPPPFTFFLTRNRSFTAWQPFSLAASSGQAPEPRSGAPKAQGLTAMRHAERQSLQLWRLGPSLHLVSRHRVLAFGSIHSTPPQGSRFSTRSAGTASGQGSKARCCDLYGALPGSGCRTLCAVIRTSSLRDVIPQCGTQRVAKCLCCRCYLARPIERCLINPNPMEDGAGQEVG